MGRDYKSAIRRSFDTDIDALRTIDPTHGMIHRGRHLNRDIYSSDIDTSQGSRIAFLSTKEAHVLPIGNWSAGSRLEIWEDVTLTSTGVALMIYLKVVQTLERTTMVQQVEGLIKTLVLLELMK